MHQCSGVTGIVSIEIRHIFFFTASTRINDIRNSVNFNTFVVLKLTEEKDNLGRR